MESLRGKLLIAGPGLLDPNFRRTVVLVGAHDAEGALGVVLNRPTDLAVEEVAPPLAELAGSGARIYVGGPVRPTELVLLAELSEPAAPDVPVLGGIGFVTGDVDPGIAPAVRRARVFAGYAGWGAGQLEAELSQASWIVEPALPQDVFDRDPEGLWSAVLRRKGGRYVLLSTMPPDPSSN
ncbi:MAG TPA: YqgE/AlgH family protein [Actinomycetota bacterium]|nr:YqgE/AlgH family protein [Actinomycetota bacterium]